MKKQLFILITLFTVTIGYSQTFTDNFITYNVTSSTLPFTVEITNYNNSGGSSVTIPDSVQNGGNAYSVTSINDNSFSSRGLTSVSFTLPSNLINIKQLAFADNALTNITIPNSVISIGYAAFGVNGLTSVVVPNSVTSLGDSAFDSNALTSVTISNSLTSLGGSVFFNNNINSVTIPNSVISIGQGAFNSNPLTCVISEATMPPTISSLSFGDRSNIYLSIPTGTASVYATAQWTGFNSVAEGLTGTFVVDNIAYQINANPNNEVTVTDYNTVGGTVVTIPDTVNSGCTAFSVVAIGINAFSNKQLTNITIGNNVISLGQSAFRQNQLTNVTIPDNVTSLGNYVFAFNQLSNIDFGIGITSIPEQSFHSNQFVNITIPDNITNIGWRAFDGNNQLNSVTSVSLVPPTIVSSNPGDSFGVGNRSGIHLHIPTGTLGAYVADAGALWTGFNPVTEDALLSASDFELTNDIKVITTTDEIRVTYSNNVELQNYTIYNMSGVIVATGKKSEIPTTYLASAIYILKLDFDKGTLAKKILIY